MTETQPAPDARDDFTKHPDIEAFHEQRREEDEAEETRQLREAQHRVQQQTRAAAVAAGATHIAENGAWLDANGFYVGPNLTLAAQMRALRTANDHTSGTVPDTAVPLDQYVPAAPKRRRTRHDEA